ncbi:MAG: NrpR regulatory domain-containing protein [Syntrophorhabdaceae bacterium]|nr:NrpR regulatory domain-containing protein [Syntrophorhabdaceae bacterium]
MERKIRKKEVVILNVLKDSERPLTSTKIAEKLELTGYDISERTIRLYLKKLEEEGLVESNGKKGCTITEKGMDELNASWIIEKVGFLSAKIDRMSYQMSFDINTGVGTVVINVTVVEPEHLMKNIEYIQKVYADGYAMGQFLTILQPGETLNHINIPPGMIGIGTVCSITLNGVLLKHGIPTISRFGGLLELIEKRPSRFVEIIMYDGTSIDPLEIFIRSGMTNYMGAIKTGNGRIGASFREFPAESKEMVQKIDEKMKRIGLGGLVGIGMPGQSFLDIPVSEGRVGAIVIGGLNPVSVLEENGVRAYSRAMAGLIDFNRLFHYKELGERLNELV